MRRVKLHIAPTQKPILDKTMMNFFDSRHRGISMRAPLVLSFGVLAALGAIAALGALAALSSRAGAETLAQVVNPRKSGNSHVSDMAHVVDGATEKRLNAIINRLERRTQAEMAVVTIRQTDGQTPKQFSTALFNQWGIGKKQRDNGVLFLVVMDAHRVEVETGRGMNRVLPDARVQQILNQHVVPLFKSDDYAGGILRGVQTLARDISAFASAPEKPVAPHRTTPSRASRSTTSTSARAPFQAPQTPSFSLPSVSSPSVSSGRNPASGSMPGWIPLAVGGLLLPLGGAAAWRSRIRRCAACNQPMRRLSESEDDVALATDQQFEENLGSVDYRVWRCDKCQTAKVERAVKWFSGYEACPRCKHQTVQSQTDIMRHPSYDHNGESRVTRRCRFPMCGWGDVQMRTLPRRTRPSSSHHHGGSHHGSSSHGSSSHSGSSGGFGGGKSSGGGAGASW